MGTDYAIITATRAAHSSARAEGERVSENRVNPEAAEDRLRDVRRELAQVARRTTLSAMTASIGHEINQPLTAIVANAQASLRWLRSPEPNVGEVQASLEQIVRDAKRASDIIENLRAMLRKDFQEGMPLSANDLVRDVLALLHGELEGHGIQVATELREDLPNIVAERVPLQQVILNLIVNAIEAMSSVTDRARRLSVKTDVHESDCILITVADEGPGINPQNMHRLFDALFTTKPHGLGMGLSVCESIVVAHGGRLWAAPGTPHGSTFRVQLPIGQ